MLVIRSPNGIIFVMFYDTYAGGKAMFEGVLSTAANQAALSLFFQYLKACYQSFTSRLMFNWQHLEQGEQTLALTFAWWKHRQNAVPNFVLLSTCHNVAGESAWWTLEWTILPHQCPCTLREFILAWALTKWRLQAMTQIAPSSEALYLVLKAKTWVWDWVANNFGAFLSTRSSFIKERL